MPDSWWPWLLRIVWVSLPFTLGQLIGDAAADASRPVQLTVTIGCWVVWAAGMLCTMIPHAIALTAIRMIAPAALLAAVWATIEDQISAWAVTSLALGTLAGLIALTPPIGAWYVNGSSYGDEQRVPLRPPGNLLAGPIPLAWLVLVALLSSAPVLLAINAWVLGAVLAVLAVPVSVLVTRSLHGLAKRWLVFVPAGLVIHDHLTLPDPVLFKRGAISVFGPALAGTTALDLTLDAVGLALEVRVDKAVPIAYRTGPKSESLTAETDAVLVAPSRPGLVLDTAKGRRIAVG